MMNKVPPDGGYGWVVTFAYALNNIVVLPLILCFGLVFQEAFFEIGLTATQASLVLVLNHGFGMLLSFLGGPILHRFGYRKVAAAGALLIFAGLLITSTASNFWMFLLSYSVINAMGVAAVMAAFSLAINSYFKEKRGRAVGVGMSLTGLGSIGMPLLINTLMYTYGWRYTILILGGICLHSFLGACLLRPVKWYLKEPTVLEEMVALNNGNNIELVNGSISTSTKLTDIHSSIRTEDEISKSVVHPVKSLSMRSLNTSNGVHTRNAISHPDLLNKTIDSPLAESKYKWWESQEINLGSSVNIFNEIEILTPKNKEIIQTDAKKLINQKPNGFLKKIIDFFDLTLLKDPVFVNILIGISMASCVETSFSLLLPIILKDMFKFETSDISKILSVIGFSDTLFRFVSPFIGEWCHKPPRVMYIVSLLIVTFIRTIMLFTSSFTGMLFVALAIGVTKGIRTVYVNVIIPSYVPIERLPFASGLQMLFNGVVIITIGSMIGRLRDYFGSYNVPILLINAFTLLTVMMWSAEFLYFQIKNRKSEETSPSN